MRVPRVRSRPMSENKTQYTIAVIPGDGIGKEVTPWAQQALEKAAGDATQFTYVDFDLGAERYLRDGEILPDEDLERIKGTDAILLGAVGDPRVKAGVLERGLLLKLRFALDQYVNLRPSKLYKGVTSPLAEPGEIDFVVVREGTEGLYCGAGGAIRKGTEHEVATEVSINTAYGVERVVRYAFDLAMKRRKHVTLVHKKNVLVNAGDMWQRIVDKVWWAAWAIPRPAASTRSTNTRRCSSRSTDPRPTSQARASRTRPPPSCRRPCCCATLDSTTPPRGSTPRSRPTSRSLAPPHVPPRKWAATSWPASDMGRATPAVHRGSAVD